jgi:predicted nucleic acid-binding protein
MRKPRIYLDTSVWNFYFAEDAPEKQSITISFFNQIKSFDIFISEVVLNEIQSAPTEKISFGRDDSPTSPLYT